MSDCAPVQQNFTRSKYDNFHQIDDNRITTYSCRYYVNPPTLQCPAIYPVNATIRLQKNGVSHPQGLWKTDIESDLKGIDRLGDRIMCENTRYNPLNNFTNNVPLINLPDQNQPMTFCRLQDPPCTLRATGWNRWIPLIHNPQETFETPFDFYIPSRLLDKERCKTHRSS